MKKIYHFYHCLLINHWYELTKEHINNLVSSVLYDELSEMSIGCLGEQKELERLQELIKPYDKIKIESYSSDVTQYEFITLKLLKKKCDELKETAYIYYSHSKSVSYNESQPKAKKAGKTWFDFLEYVNCQNWRKAVKVLDFGYDGYGCKLIHKRVSPSTKTHYSGNGFWCNSDYIKSLPKIETLNHKDRFSAEMYVGEYGAVLFTNCQLFVDYNCTSTFDELLKGGHVKELI